MRKAEQMKQKAMEGLMPAGIGILGGGIILVLFYDRLAGVIPSLVAGAYIAGVVVKERKRRRLQRRRDTFKRLLVALETGLEAGYSLENAVLSAVEDMERLCRRGSGTRKLLEGIRRKTQLRTSVWQVMLYYAEETGVEEAEELAEVLRIQQRAGGNLIETMRRTVRKLQAGMELQQEVEMVIAEKRLEQRIMTLMPAGILLYMRVVNYSYIEPLYTTAGGLIVMTVMLGLNLLGDMLGNRIVS